MPRPSQSEIADLLLDAATKAGAGSADVVIFDGVTQSIDVRDGALERAERAEGIDIGLRVILGQKQATVASSDGSVDALRMMAERAVAMAQEAPDDPTVGLADPSQLTSDIDVSGLELEDPTDEPSPAVLDRKSVV